MAGRRKKPSARSLLEKFPLRRRVGKLCRRRPVHAAGIEQPSAQLAGHELLDLPGRDPRPGRLPGLILGDQRAREGEPDAGAEVLGVGCDGDQGLGGGFEQQAGRLPPLGECRTSIGVDLPIP